MLLPAIRVPALEPTNITGVMAAVRGFTAFHRPLEFSFQESCRYAYINMSPGQGLVQSALATGIEAGFKSALGKGAVPVFIIKVFIPGIKD